MRIDDRGSPDYESVRLHYIGLVDPYAIEGLMILSSTDGREFMMRAFSGEIAKHIKSFSKGNDKTQTIYSMFEEMCEQNGDILVKVKIYESGDALRANLYFTGKKDTILRNYRASDAVALAIFYGVPILIRSTLLKEKLNA
ncbi:MAG: Bifunctional nuclease [Cenarchaeum symbiont of Oopsacas minuta]|nr:Bifunctional nuclease [Cenarchaeum symbiont of Oopsacas minuta]